MFHVEQKNINFKVPRGTYFMAKRNYLDIQQDILNQIDKNSKNKLVDELMDTLSISSDSAYRRIRLEKIENERKAKIAIETEKKEQEIFRIEFTSSKGGDQAQQFILDKSFTYEQAILVITSPNAISTDASGFVMAIAGLSPIVIT